MRNDCRFEEDFEQRRYCQVAAAVVGSTVVGAVGSSMAADSQAESAEQASAAQSESARAQIEESRRQFDEIRKLLSPYTSAGERGLQGQIDLLGLNPSGPQSMQKAAIDAIAGGQEMAELTRQGENAILQNASATGGLRGGNTQGALAQFRPALLNSLIDKQYSRLGGLTMLGQNSAAGVGAAGQFASGQVNSALQQQGAAQAGNALAQGRAQAGLYGGLAQAAGGAFGQLSGGLNPFGAPPVPNPALNTGGTGFGGTGFETFGNQGWGAYT